MTERDFRGLFTRQGKVEIGTPYEFSFVQVRHLNNSFS